MPQELGWSVEAKLLYQIKQLTKALSSRSYIQTYANFASFPNPGITGTLYVDEATGDIYVWNGTSYVLLSSGITALNGLIAAAQLFATGSAGTDFNISSVGTTHTFNIPTASAANRGLLSSGDWTTFNGKQNAITLTTTGTSGAATLVGSTLNIPQYQSALTNPITGTGTTNYLSKFTGTTTLGNSQIFDNGTNVGIGTASPLSKLQVSGEAVIANGSPTSTENGLHLFFDTNVGYITSEQPGTTFRELRVQGSPLILQTAGTERLRITAGGNVGIGTTTPSTLLDVRGELSVAYNALYGIRFYNQDRNNWSFIGNSIATGSTDANLKLGDVSGEVIRLTGGKVLIGTTTDTGEKFQVAGTARVTQSAYFATASGGVGIGTTSLYLPAGYKSMTFDGTTGSVILFRNSGTSGFEFSSNATDVTFYAYSTRNIAFYTNNLIRLYIAGSTGNVGIAQSTFGTSATNTLAISSGTAPSTSPADCFQLYSQDITAGNAAPHFRTENGAVVKVYQETTAVAAATFVQGSVNAVYEDSTFDGYTLKQIVKALRNQGLLA